MGRLFRTFPLDPLQNHRELSLRDLDSPLTRHRKGKRPLLQALVQEPEPIAVPYHQLHAVLRPVEEGKHIARERVVLELIPNNRAQTIVGLAEIHGAAAQEDPVAPSQA
jgi:hypothetical protein